MSRNRTTTPSFQQEDKSIDIVAEKMSKIECQKTKITDNFQYTTRFFKTIIVRHREPRQI